MNQLVGISTTVFFIITTTVAFQAQTAKIFKIDIPFEFIINDRTLPAGRYSIGRLNEQNPDLLLFRKKDGRTNILVLTQRANGEPMSARSMLSFNRYGESVFLKSVWAANERYGSTLVQSSSERKRMMSGEAKIVSLFEPEPR